MRARKTLLVPLVLEVALVIAPAGCDTTDTKTDASTEIDAAVDAPIDAPIDVPDPPPFD